MLRLYFYYKAVGRLTDCGLPPLLARSIVKSREHVSAIHLALSVTCRDSHAFTARGFDIRHAHALYTKVARPASLWHARIFLDPNIVVRQPWLCWH